MNTDKVDYETVVEDQARLLQKRGTEKKKGPIEKDKEYFDSTELPKLLNQVRDVEEQHKVNTSANPK